jgi:hypothetical protein
MSAVATPSVTEVADAELAKYLKSLSQPTAPAPAVPTAEEPVPEPVARSEVASLRALLHGQMKAG